MIACKVQLMGMSFDFCIETLNEMFMYICSSSLPVINKGGLVKHSLMVKILSTEWANGGVVTSSL